MRAPLALLAAFLAGLTAACGSDQAFSWYQEKVTAGKPRPAALAGEIVRRSHGLLIVLRDDLTAVLINDRQAYRACLLHARYPECRERK